MSALLEIEQLEVGFGSRTAAVRGTSLTVERGETHCLVGESGCGKSVTALAVMNLLARGGYRRAKRMSFQGEDLLKLNDRGMARLRGNAMAMIFQEPMTSLNPAYTVGSQMTEVLRRHKGTSQRVATDRAADLLARVGITAPGLRLGQRPHSIAGTAEFEGAAALQVFGLEDHGGAGQRIQGARAQHRGHAGVRGNARRRRQHVVNTGQG
ncbi:MAG: ATP-binding cassette domain-containing protein [Reyranella sp.]|nr:ATP-binding cassette domain-containing protein [Reyranella sp.]